MKVKELRKLIKEILNEVENQVVDANATLRALQSKVKSGSEVTIEGKPVFKMPMINLATFIGGGRIQLPTNGEALEAIADVILVDGSPLELIYKAAPIPTPKPFSTPSTGNTSRWTDPDSIFYRGGD
jgi:hypothetical protein